MNKGLVKFRVGMRREIPRIHITSVFHDYAEVEDIPEPEPERTAVMLIDTVMRDDDGYADLEGVGYSYSSRMFPNARIYELYD